jgi:hypothetical protein
VARQALAATVRIDMPDGGHGSGFAQRLPDGSVWVWTCGHVARNTPNAPRGEGDPPGPRPLPVTISRTVQGRHEVAGRHEWRGELVRLSGEPDAAVYRLMTNPHPDDLGSLELAAAAPAVGDPVAACGSPEGLDATLTRGEVVFVGRRTKLGFCDHVTAPTLPGSSGGPVVDAAGRVVGLTQGGPGETHTLTVPARDLRAWAGRAGLGFLVAGTSPPALAAVRAPGVVHPHFTD